MEDKENVRPSQRGNVLADAKQADGIIKRLQSRNTFGKLLSEAKNEIMIEQDERVALKTHVEDAVNQACAWVREESDRLLAEELVKNEQSALESEKQRKLALLRDNERTAMKLAMEERYRVLTEAENRREIESKDEEYARRMAEEEESAYHVARKAQYDCDEDFAYRLQKELEDEILAKQIIDADENEHHQMTKADEKIAQAKQQQYEKQWKDVSEKQAERDREIARTHQEEIDLQLKLKDIERQRLDTMLSAKLAIKESRLEHQRQKRLRWIQSEQYKPVYTTEEMNVMWSEANAEIDDVEAGICITLILPQLNDLKIQMKSSNKLRVKATRVSDKPKSFFSSSSTNEFIGEFIIDGANVNLKEKDVSYEYVSETGLLYIYLENLNLEEEMANKETSSSSGFNLFQRLFQ